MEALTLIKSRRSTRRFRQTPIEEEKLNDILEAGRYAPSGGNSQSAHLLVIRNQEILTSLAELVKQEFAAMEEIPGMYRSIVNSIRLSKKGDYVFHYAAPVLIVVANQKDYGNNIADCSCILENMMLMANALDLGSCWINQLKWLNENPAVLSFMQKLGLKDEERVYGALAVGYADTEDGLPEREALQRTGNQVTYID